MIPENQRKLTAEEALEQTRRNRQRAAILESRDGPVLPEDALKPKTSHEDSEVDKSTAN